MALNPIASRADLSLAWAALLEPDRQWLRSTCDVLGLPPDGWRAVPALRDIVVMLAAEILAASMDLPAVDACAEAFRALRVGDGLDAADSAARRLRRWRADAWSLPDPADAPSLDVSAIADICECATPHPGPSYLGARYCAVCGQRCPRESDAGDVDSWP